MSLLVTLPFGCSDWSMNPWHILLLDLHPFYIPAMVTCFLYCILPSSVIRCNNKASITKKAHLEPLSYCCYLQLFMTPTIWSRKEGSKKTPRSKRKIGVVSLPSIEMLADIWFSTVYSDFFKLVSPDAWETGACFACQDFGFRFLLDCVHVFHALSLFEEPLPQYCLSLCVSNRTLPRGILIYTYRDYRDILNKERIKE